MKQIQSFDYVSVWNYLLFKNWCSPVYSIHKIFVKTIMNHLRYHVLQISQEMSCHCYSLYYFFKKNKQPSIVYQMVIVSCKRRLGAKGHVSICHRFMSVINLSQFDHFLHNYWANWNQTLQELCLWGLLQNSSFRFDLEKKHGCQGQFKVSWIGRNFKILLF